MPLWMAIPFATVTPTVAATGSASITPDPLAIPVSSVNPTVSGSGSVSVTPDPLAIQVSPVAPTIAATGTVTIDSLRGERKAATPAALGNATGTIKFTVSATGLERLTGDLTLADVAVADWAFSQIPVQLSLEDDLVSLAAQLDAPEVALTITVGGALQELRNRLSFEVTGSLFPRNLPLPADASAHGRVQFSVAGEVSEPMLLASLPPAAWMRALTLDGQAKLDLRDIRYTRAYAADTLRGSLVWSLRDNTLLIDAANELRAEIRVPEQLIGRFGDLVPDTVDIRLGGPGATPPSLSVTPGDDGWNIALATGASIPSLNVSAETDLRLDIDQAFRLRELTVPFLLAEVTSLAPFGLDGTAEIAATNVAGGIKSASAEISGSAALATWRNNGLRAAGLRAELDATVVWKDQNLTLQLDPSTRVSLDSLAANSFNIGPTTLALSPAAPGSLTIGADGSLTYDLSFAPFTAKISAPADTIETDLRRLHVAGSKNGAALTFDAADVTAPSRNIVASDVTGSLEVERDGRAAWDVTIGNVAQTGADSWFSTVTVELAGTRSTGGELSFDAHLTNPEAGLDLRAQGTHDVSARGGATEITMAPLSFSAGGLQPGDLSPRLGDLISDVSGGLRAGGTIAWHDDIVESDLAITLDALDLKAKRLDLQDLTGDLRITGLRPPATAADQTITFAVKQGQLGALPIDVTFQLKSDGQLDIKSLTVEAIGGRIRAQNMTIATADPFPVETTLLVEDVDLGQLLALANVEGLTGSGRLNGRIPLRLEDGKIAINGGTLAAAGSGTVQFDRAKLPAALLAKGDIVSIALETLTDFNYDSLDMQISKSLQGDGVVKVQLAGANPDVLDGHPFNFNIAFESDFDRLARLVTEGLAAADTALLNAAGAAAR